MRTTILGLLFSLAFSAIAASQSAKKPPREDVPSFSANAITIYSPPYSSDDSLKAAPSPDSRKKIQIKFLDSDNVEGIPAILAMDDERHLTSEIRFGLDAEVLWSPDSMAFTVTGSSEGANGQYETDVFSLSHGELAKTEITPLVEKAFGHPVRCSWSEPPNVGAIKWLVPSKEILVAAEIIHHSNCDSYGTFEAYAVDVAKGRIVKRYDQLEAKKLFGTDLGQELLEADDRCIRSPRACWVYVNHPAP
jgi:hypothetical protein